MPIRLSYQAAPCRIISAMKKNLVIIKLGGSIITNKKKEFVAKETVIRRLAREILEAQKATGAAILLGHGSGSFGHVVATKYGVKDGLTGKKSFLGLPLVANAAIAINRIVIKNCLGEKLPVVSFSPASFITAENRAPKSLFDDPIRLALETGFTPVVYGDVIMDSQIGFCIYSTEKTLGLIASKLKKYYDKITIVYCGDTNGVYDENKKTISKITKNNFLSFKRSITGSAGTDVTGGMLHKIEECLAVAEKLGIATLIINGNTKGELKRALLGKKVKGTLIS